MRNVTINTGKSVLIEAKRGRGRPPKPGALTNAQRQAAYRARKRDDPSKAEEAKSGGSNIEMRGLRADLVRTRESLRLEQENALAAAKSHERQTALLRKRVVLVEEELRHLKENLKASEGGPAFEVMLQLLAMACVRKSVNAQIAIRDSDIWKKGVVRAPNVTDEQMKRLAAALEGKI
jgi:hypothetical protein